MTPEWCFAPAPPWRFALKLWLWDDKVQARAEMTALNASMGRVERDVIIDALNACSGNQTRETDGLADTTRGYPAAVL